MTCLTDEVIDHRPDPTEEIDRADQVALLLTKLATLPKQDQDILRQRIWEEWSFKQIARENGLAFEAVRKRFQRDHRRLIAMASRHLAN